MFSSWSLNRKLISAFTASAFALVLVGGVGAYTLSQVSAHYKGITAFNLPNISAVGEMRIEAKRIETAVALLADTDVSPDRRQQAREAIETAIKEYAKADEAYLSVPFAPGEERIYDKQNAHWKKALQAAQELSELSSSKASTAPKEYLETYLETYLPEAELHDSEIVKLKLFHKTAANRAVAESDRLSQIGNSVSVATVIVGFLFAILTGWYISRSLSRTLSDLAQRMSGEASHVADSAKSISDAGAALSSSATEQAAALQETVASVDEISAMISKNADNAKRSQSVSARSHETAGRGKARVEEMIGSIDEIDKSNNAIMAQIEASNRQISDIVKVIAEIGNKTKVINDIVFQTKLLSFNASVEAARAGEHGKGFAVVAEEVGNLAQMSGNSAKEISDMLESSIQKVENIVNDTKSKVEKLIVTGRQKVEIGAATARQCGEALEEIVANVAEVNSLIVEIATASDEQSKGVEEITKAMGQLDQVTQQNASASEESSTASDQLARQAAALRGMVSDLTRTITGSEDDSISAPPPSSQPVIKLDMHRKPTNRPRSSEPRIERFQKVSGLDEVPRADDPDFDEF